VVQKQIRVNDETFTIAGVMPRGFEFPPMGSAELVLPTFRRFLNQLWKATMPEAIPDDICGPGVIFSGPIFVQ
jgi:hypothetical protein